MPLPISKEHIADRLRDYSHNNYLYIGNIINGVALSLGALALMQILLYFQTSWIKLLPWAVSLEAILVSYMTVGRGILVTNSRSNTFDSIFPFLMGITEFLLFGVLIDYGTTTDFWLRWFTCLGCYTLVAVGITANRLHNSRVAADFDDELKVLGLTMERWVRADRNGALILAALSFVCCLIVKNMQWWPQGPYSQMICRIGLTIPFVWSFGRIILRANYERMYIDEMVSKMFVSPESRQA